MELQSYATVTQEGRHPTRTTEEYRFLSTARALEILDDRGWYPVRIDEANYRKAENRGFQKHLVRLQNAAYSQSVGSVAKATPEIVLKNSHNGESALRLFGGIFEAICLNGLIVWDELSDCRRLPHRGMSELLLADILQSVVESIPTSFETRERWRGIRLDRHEQLAYAEAVIPLVFDGGKYAVEPSELLYSRHVGQHEPSLWNTFNRVHGNLLRGGVRRTRIDGSRIRSRAVKDVDENVRINRELWRVAAELERALN